MMGKQKTNSDAVDRIMAEWKQQQPKLNAWPMAVIGRISRLERMIDRQMEAVCHRFGIERWGFDVLASLRRAGSPFQLTPTQLYRSLMLTSGAITNRLDRLELAGLVKRKRDPSDRRGLLVGLTSKGQEVVDRAVVAHMEVEERMLANLSMKSQRELAVLLRALSETLESLAGSGKQHIGGS